MSVTQNTNVSLLKVCIGYNYSYELNDGMSIDRSISNFLQLIKNF